MFRQRAALRWENKGVGYFVENNSRNIGVHNFLLFAVIVAFVLECSHVMIFYDFIRLAACWSGAAVRHPPFEKNSKTWFSLKFSVSQRDFLIDFLSPKSLLIRVITVLNPCPGFEGPSFSLPQFVGVWTQLLFVFISWFWALGTGVWSPCCSRHSLVKILGALGFLPRMTSQCIIHVRPFWFR